MKTSQNFVAFSEYMNFTFSVYRRLAQTNGFVEYNGVGRTFDFMLGRNVLPRKSSRLCGYDVNSRRKLKIIIIKLKILPP